MNFVAILLFLIILFTLTVIGSLTQKTKKKHDILLENIAEKEQYIIRLQSEKKSLETKYGFCLETFVPFLNCIDNADPKGFHYLGQPIDYIYFGSDEIIFIEVKTGKSQLKDSQKRVRTLINDNKVSFKEIRITNSNENTQHSE